MKTKHKVLMSGIRWGLLMALCGVGFSVQAGDEQHCTKGGTGSNQAKCGMMGEHALPDQGALAFSDNGLGYRPSYGPWFNLRVRLVESERASLEGSSFGQFRGGVESYIDAAVAGEMGSQIKSFDLDGGYRFYEFTSDCRLSPEQCASLKDGVSGSVLMKLGRMSPSRPSGVVVSDLAWSKLVELWGGLSEGDKARSYVKYLEDGGLVFYGKVVGAGSSYRSHVSALIDADGLSAGVEYDTSGGLLRVRRLVGADGLSVRYYYADTEPSSGGYADSQISSGLRRNWDALLSGAEALHIRRLVTSMVDPYGRRVRYDYQDGLTGLRLRGMAGSDWGSDGAFDAQRVQESRYMRLLSVEDVVGVRSEV